MMKELSDSVMASGQWKMGCDWILCFSEQDKLVEFDIGNEVVNYLFSAKDLNAEEFVAKFAEAYHTPEFKHRPLPQDDSVWVWDCITPDNVLVRIQENKSIGMFKQKASNPQNGFN
jgi:hypothetical protein